MKSSPNVRPVALQSEQNALRIAADRLLACGLAAQRQLRAYQLAENARLQAEYDLIRLLNWDDDAVQALQDILKSK